MPRFILIDNASGFIFGDTAGLSRRVVIDGLPARDHEITPLLAARWLDTAIGEHGRRYEESCRLASNETGYRVYRADVRGSEAVPVVWDGQDPEAIEAVERDCEWVGCIRVLPQEDRA